MNFESSKKQVNNYINNTVFADRHKYLILGGNTKYIMNDNGVLSSNSEYKNGSMLNKIEYCISTGDNSCNSGTYLLIPSSYWTLTGNSTSRYYINNASGLQTQSDSMSSNARVTEFVKSNVEVSGNGTYNNPWVFNNQYLVSLRISNKNQAYFGSKDNQKVLEEKYADNCSGGRGLCTEYEITTIKGYKNNTKDGCNLKYVNNINILEDKSRLNKYEITNINSDINCVLLFDRKKFNIIYNCGVGSGNPTNQTVLYNDRIKISNNVCSKTGYTQNGWQEKNTSENWQANSNIQFNYDDGEHGIQNQTLDLIAKFNPNKYTVSFDCDGGTNAPANQVATFDSNFTLTSSICKKVGYTQKGWKDQNGVTWTAENTKNWKWNYTYNPVLKAQWQADNTCDGRTPTYIGTVKMTLKPVNAWVNASVLKVDDEVNNIHNTYGTGYASYYGKKATPDLGVTVGELIGGGHGPDYFILYSLTSDIYYSTSKTTNVSQMHLLSNLYLSVYTNSATYYIYKLGCVKYPENFTFVGDFHTGARGGIGGPKIAVYDKPSNVGYTMTNGTNLFRGNNFSYFGVVGADDSIASYARDVGLYYSYNPTTIESDLKPFSAIEWSPFQNNRFWIYKRNTVKVPKNYKLISEVHTASTHGIGGAKVFVIDKINNKADLFSDNGLKTFTYSGFKLKYYWAGEGGIWFINPHGNNLYYSTYETDNAANLAPFNRTLSGKSLNSRYYIYQKQ